MPDPKQETLPETPATPETPSADVSSEATLTPVETPASSNSTEQQVETESKTTHGKTLEQKAADAAHWQSEAQRAKEELRAIQTPEEEAPVVPQPQPQLQSQPQPQQPAVPQSQDELNELLRENPMLGFEAFGNSVIDRIEAKIMEGEKRRELESQSREANKVVKDFCARNKVSAETLKSAQKWISESGLKGSPPAISGAMIDRIQYLQLINSNQETVIEAAAKAATAAQTQALTMQPETVVPDTQAPQTVEDQIASKFRPSKADEFENQF